jgi:hypothetical protein
VILWETFEAGILRVIAVRLLLEGQFANVTKHAILQMTSNFKVWASEK